MKTLLKKMKTITMCSMLLVISFLCNAQNEMIFTNYVYDDSVRIDTFEIDITYLKDNSLIDYNLANYIISYCEIPMLRNLDGQKRAFAQTFYTLWGSTLVNNYLTGNFSGGNINQFNLFELCFSENTKSKDELILRLRKELNGTINVGDTCAAINLANNKIVGIYRGEIADGVVLRKKGGEYALCYPYTVCIANEEEINKYY